MDNANVPDHIRTIACGEGTSGPFAAETLVASVDAIVDSESTSLAEGCAASRTTKRLHIGVNEQMSAEIRFRVEGASANKERTSIDDLAVVALVVVYFLSIRSRHKATVIGGTLELTFFMAITVVTAQHSVAGVCSFTFAARIIRPFAV